MLAGSDIQPRALVSWQAVVAIITAIFLHGVIASYFLLPAQKNNSIPTQASPQVFEINIIAAPKAEPTALPEGPKQQESAPAKRQTAEPETQLAEPKVKPIVESKSDFTIVDKKPKPIKSKPEEKPIKKKSEAKPLPEPVSQDTPIEGNSEQLIEKTSAPAALPVRQAEIASGPTKGKLSEQESTARQLWQSILQAHLEKRKRYPRMAKLKRQQGVPWVTFTMDRKGNVMDVSLFKASGIAALDKEVIDLVKRAEPLPIPPTEVKGNPLTMAVPVAFFIQ